jgi:glycosyltransferase involved in cell wall biosynthesis
MKITRNNKKLLVIAYYFPPVGGGGIQRTLKFAKYLPRYNWEPVILSVKDIAYRSYDPTPLEEIPGVPITRTGSLDPFRIANILKRATGRTRLPVFSGGHFESFVDLKEKSAEKHGITTRRTRIFASLSKYVFLPDIQIMWAPFALIKALSICRSEKVAAIYTTSPPESAHLVGLALKKLTGLPWVADFRDVWERSFWRQRLPVVHRWINRKLEDFVLSAADGLVLNTWPALDRIKKMIRLDIPVAVIPNGFDLSDFTGKGIDRRDDRFIIVHFGNFGAGLDAASILRAFASAGENNSDFAEKAVLYLLGVGVSDDAAEVRRLGLEGKVVFAGYLAHREGLRFCKAADLLLLVMGPSFEEERVPGKLYEYMGAGKPVLAAAPEGEAARLVRAVYGESWVVGPADVPGIAGRFVEEFERRRRGIAPPVPDPVLISGFERRKLTSRLAEFLDKVIAGSKKP